MYSKVKKIVNAHSVNMNIFRYFTEYCSTLSSRTTPTLSTMAASKAISKAVPRRVSALKMTINNFSLKLFFST